MKIFAKFKTVKSLTLIIPEGLNLNEKDTKRFLAAKLYESGRLSLGQAAELAGLSKTTFSEILCDYNVSLINYPSSDIIKDAARF
jgi:predicted HTH domain antitoxin